MHKEWPHYSRRHPAPTSPALPGFVQRKLHLSATQRSNPSRPGRVRHPPPGWARQFQQHNNLPWKVHQHTNIKPKLPLLVGHFNIIEPTQRKNILPTSKHSFKQNRCSGPRSAAARSWPRWRRRRAPSRAPRGGRCGEGFGWLRGRWGTSSNLPRVEIGQVWEI